MFNRFKIEMKSYLIFSIHEIEKSFPNFDKKNLVRWQKNGYITKIRNGFYYFTDTELNENFLYLVANEIYSPSYISFESALSYYNIIPEGVFSVISATTLKTNSFSTQLCEFSYMSIKPTLFFGYKLIEYQGHRYKIASLEKTILDYVYIKNNLKSVQDFEGLRWNKEVLKQINVELFNEYLAHYNSKALSSRIHLLNQYIHA
jgi:predicted transcriptional regulator of viral defense system